MSMDELEDAICEIANIRVQYSKRCRKLYEKIIDNQYSIDMNLAVNTKESNVERVQNIQQNPFINLPTISINNLESVKEDIEDMAKLMEMIILMKNEMPKSKERCS
ncbi:hypothetical protein O3M35_004064 [Rhynocoris fuscipes]|uniref:Uncharacterized protein n=1 Tax=Rhynocoris fuscipes TaxID=488301 RepID=A0AAW1CH88_9HEMI